MYFICYIKILKLFKQSENILSITIEKYQEDNNQVHIR